jgi:thiol:disulfide interchange protein DsbA
MTALLALGACGRQETAPSASAPPAAEPSVAEAPAPEAAQADSTATSAVSETDEPAEANAQSSAVQPSMRVGPAPSGPPTSARFREGRHYRRIVPAQPTSAAPGAVEVIEAFWYGCGHCFAIDPAVDSWSRNGKPEYVQFMRLPAMWNETTRMHARLYYTAEELGKLDEVHSQIFREIHVNNNPLNTMDAMIAFFQRHGVSEQEFRKASSSFGVETKLQRADLLNRRYRIESVPVFLVNGKYRTGLGEAGGESELFALLGELAAHEHGG